ncbi:unnamed protein product [Paramecium primaurelia]|uniref:Uncharacterized protein n=1 Tax=Paramecium primaurelia TaxID=5886 RepID=A0A8S1KSJ7_PARPR|nr:unnamed protein product [Paramecium primaurelia]
MVKIQPNKLQMLQLMSQHQLFNKGLSFRNKLLLTYKMTFSQAKLYYITPTMLTLNDSSHLIRIKDYLVQIYLIL